MLPSALALRVLALTLVLSSSALAQLRRSAPAPASAAPAAAPAPAVIPAPPPASAAAPVPAEPQAADFIVAIVNSEPITNSEVRARLPRLQQQLARQGGSPPPREQLLEQIRDQLINERAQLQVARDAGIRADIPAVDQAEQDLARQNGVDVAELRRRALAEGVSEKQLREDLSRQLILVRVREREVEARIAVSEREIDDFLREQAAAASGQAVALNLAQVLIAVPETASPAQVEALRLKAERIRQRAQAGEDFAVIAREASDAPDAAASGGAFGLRPTDRYPSVFLDATQSLAVGGVSAVLRTGAGFHVLKVLQKQQEPSMAVTQQRARHILLRPGPRLAEAAARERLAEFKRRIESGAAEFALLARENSQDGSAAAGGDLGWANPGMFVPEFEAVLASLAPGEMAPPFTSRFGVHLLQLLERRRVALGPREQREAARNALRERRLDEAYARWVQDVRGRAFVQLREPPQ
jgi:peptidyl-prolyl cis-trans isomerase SurA